MFVKGVKIAQIPCGQMGIDLRDARLNGESRHGFRYESSRSTPVKPSCASPYASRPQAIRWLTATRSFLTWGPLS